jgi:uncharacterized protein YkwD
MKMPPRGRARVLSVLAHMGMRTFRSRVQSARGVVRLFRLCGRWCHGKHGKALAALIALFVLFPPLEWAHAQPAAHKKDRAANPRDKAEAGLKPADEAFMEDMILRLTNLVRKRRGLIPLKSSRALVFLARHHSQDMCRTGVFKHESESFPKGWRRFMERIRIVGLYVGAENIAYHTITDDPKKLALSVVKGWLGSPPHLKNILSPSFRYVGVGIGNCGQRILYVTQVFSIAPGQPPELQRLHPAPR